MKFWLAKHAVRGLIVVIGVMVIALELSRAMLRTAVRWL